MNQTPHKPGAHTIPVIILAGGLGTRLSSVVKDLPKPMAPVNGKPFLHYIFEYLKREEVEQVILSVGHLHEAIRSYFGDQFLGINIQYSIEQEPLGTGGAIRQAFELVNSRAFVLNGDTFFDISLNELQGFYYNTNADIALSLKRLQQFDRYGTVDINEEGRILAFHEKKYCDDGLINGGVYLMHKRIFETQTFPEKFSFEKEVLEALYATSPFYGRVFDGYFIDIGIPEDYARANHDFGGH